jgi:hypothetical protein
VEGPEILEENAQTIQPNQSPPSAGNPLIVKHTTPKISLIVEDYSNNNDDVF